MNVPEAQQTLFNDLVADLADQHKAEFFQNLHEAGISPNDVELARLLRSLQLYKAYYESIPAAVQAAAAEIERLKQEIDRLSADARRSSEASANCAGQVIQEAEHVRQDLTKIHEQVEEATRGGAERVAGRMADFLSVSLETALHPLETRLAELAGSNGAFDDAIARSDQAAAALTQNAALARRVHLGAYALATFLIACALSLGSWFSLHQWYEDRIKRERADLVQQVEKNRAVLLKLAEWHRTLELLQDPDHPSRKLLVMKDASGWQSTRNHGVIEFNH
jgi:DNA repair exonuclease SbcCD ATPase subunit